MAVVKSKFKAKNGSNYDIHHFETDVEQVVGLDNLVNSIASIPNMIELTYQDLVGLRDNNQLVKGTQYCIIDFVTTTNQNMSHLYISAEHFFDVIVVADSENTLNENARARARLSNTSRNYFIDNHAKVESWELKYCLDNDVDRFEWANVEDGNGVIYYMKDEHLNECNYDFKNIMYKCYSNYNDGCWGNRFDTFPLENINTVAENPQIEDFVYTFFVRDHNGNIHDASVVYDLPSKEYEIMQNKITHQTVDEVSGVPNLFYTEKLSFLVFNFANSCKNNVFTNCKYGSFIGVEDVNISNSEIMVGNMVRNINLVKSDIFILEDVSNVKIAGTIKGSRFRRVYDTMISGNVDFYNLHDLHGSQITVGINENCRADFCNLNEPDFQGDQWIGFVCCRNANVKGIKFDGCKPVLVDVETG